MPVHAIKSSSPWLPSFHEDSNGLPRLFCLASAGGSAEFYRSWQKHLAQEAVICPIELPGRGSRSAEPFMKDIEDAVRGICDCILPYTSEPYALFGHSLGAILGMQVAVMFHNSEQPLPSVFMASGVTPPHLGMNTVPPADATEEMLLDEMCRMGGTPEYAIKSRELIDYFLPILRKDYCLARSCKPYSPLRLDMPIAVFGGESDRDAPYELLEKWQEMNVRPCEVNMFPGGHFFLMDHQVPVLDEVGRQLRKHISLPLGKTSQPDQEHHPKKSF